MALEFELDKKEDDEGHGRTSARFLIYKLERTVVHAVSWFFGYARRAGLNGVRLFRQGSFF